MKIFSFCNMEYSAMLSSLMKIEANSVAIVNFNVNGKIDLLVEMTAAEGKIRQLADISRERKAIFFLGFTSELMDKSFLSILVIRRGKLMGMSDMTHYLSDMYNVGKSYKCYDIGEVTVGAISCDDIYFPEVYRAMCLEGAELIIAIHNKPMREPDSNVVAANAYMNGTSVIAQFSDGVIVAAEGAPHPEINKGATVSAEIELTVNNRFLTAVRDDYGNVEEID